MLRFSKTIFDLNTRAIDTCASYGAHLWVPHDRNDQRNLISIMNAWIGVVVDPPHWYALKDWLNAGCTILTDGYFTEQAVDNYLQQEGRPDSYIQGLTSQELQPNITW